SPREVAMRLAATSAVGSLSDSVTGVARAYYYCGCAQGGLDPARVNFGQIDRRAGRTFAAGVGQKQPHCLPRLPTGWPPEGRLGPIGQRSGSRLIPPGSVSLRRAVELVLHSLTDPLHDLARSCVYASCVPG